MVSDKSCKLAIYCQFHTEKHMETTDATNMNRHIIF